jgi:hypothetical protein
LEFRNVEENRRKTLEARERINNKFNSHMTPIEYEYHLTQIEASFRGRFRRKKRPG